MKKLLLLSLLFVGANALANTEAQRVEQQFNNPSTFFINGKDANSNFMTTTIEIAGTKKVYETKVKDLYSPLFNSTYTFIKKENGKEKVIQQFSFTSLANQIYTVARMEKQDFMKSITFEEGKKPVIEKDDIKLGLWLADRVVVDEKSDKKVVLETNIVLNNLIELESFVNEDNYEFKLPNVSSYHLQLSTEIQLGKERLLFENKEGKILVLINKVKK